MMSESTEACPVHLLYKDQRGWSVDKGGELPSRHVAGGNRGIKIHIIEVIYIYSLYFTHIYKDNVDGVAFE